MRTPNFWVDHERYQASGEGVSSQSFSDTLFRAPFELRLEQQYPTTDKGSKPCNCCSTAEEMFVREPLEAIHPKEEIMARY